MEQPQDLDRFLRKNKSHEDLKYVPVVGLVNSDLSKTIHLRNLFFHLLERPFEAEALRHTVFSAQTDFKRFMALIKEVNSRNSAIGLINSGKFRLQTMDQAEALTTMLSLACPDPAIIALGLSELMVNAIEHGNLNISFDEKTRLMESGEWEQEVKRRLQDDLYKDRFVEINFNRTDDLITFCVTDQGNGFDWRPFIKDELSMDTARHGRGIALALAMGFDELVYNEKGNQVTARIHMTAS